MLARLENAPLCVFTDTLVYCLGWIWIAFWVVRMRSLIIAEIEMLLGREEVIIPSYGKSPTACGRYDCGWRCMW